MPRYLILLGAFFLLGGCVSVLITTDQQTRFHTENQHDVRYFRTTQVQGTVISQTGNRVLIQPFQYTGHSPLPPLEIQFTDDTELTLVTEKTSYDHFVSREQVTMDSLSLQTGDTVRAFFDREATNALTAYIVRKIEVQAI